MARRYRSRRCPLWDVCEAWDESTDECTAHECRWGYDEPPDPETRGDERYHADKEEGRL